jgi:hypothetical protein
MGSGSGHAADAPSLPSRTVDRGCGGWEKLRDRQPRRQWKGREGKGREGGSEMREESRKGETLPSEAQRDRKCRKK